MIRTSFAILFVLCSSAAMAQAPVVTEAQAELAAHPWQLVGFRSSDGRIFTPDDRGKYTLTFDREGGMAARIDCNRVSGSWTSAKPGELRFSQLDMTRAQCEPGSLSDRILPQWTSVRSYVVRNGKLLLTLDGGRVAFEFEPATSRGAAPRR